MMTFKLSKDTEKNIIAKVGAALRKKLPPVLDFAWWQILYWTPVNTGKMIANWHAETGRKSNLAALDAVEEPARVEPTNDLPLGVEGRRRANQMVAESHYAFDFQNPFGMFYIYNPTAYARDVEYGVLPVSPPFTPRNPAGTVRIAMIATKERFGRL